MNVSQSFDLGVDGVLEQGRRGVGLRAGVAEGERAALLDGAQCGEVGEAGEQVLSCVLAEEGHVVVAAARRRLVR